MSTIETKLQNSWAVLEVFFFILKVFSALLKNKETLSTLKLYNYLINLEKIVDEHFSVECS